MKRFLMLLSLAILVTTMANAQYYDEKKADKLSKKEQRRLKKEEARKAFEFNKGLA